MNFFEKLLCSIIGLFITDENGKPLDCKAKDAYFFLIVAIVGIAAYYFVIYFKF